MKGKNILLITENPYVNAYVSNALRKGYAVKIASRGDVLTTLKTQSIDGIILDEVLSNIDKKLLRKLGGEKNMPVIVLSSMIGVAIDVFDSFRVFDCIIKPFSPRCLFETAKNAFNSPT